MESFFTHSFRRRSALAAASGDRRTRAAFSSMNCTISSDIDTPNSSANAAKRAYVLTDTHTFSNRFPC